MKLPNGHKAIVDRRKLTDYCLDPEHSRGKHKARVFATVLGFTRENAEQLRSALLAAAATGNARPSLRDRYGTRYTVDCEITGPKGASVLRSTWIIRHGEEVPRLTSCYLK